MFLKIKVTGDLIQVCDLEALCDPFQPEILGVNQSGENEQEEGKHAKADLVFPSDETLPVCWCDPDYKPVDAPERSQAKSGRT